MKQVNWSVVISTNKISGTSFKLNWTTYLNTSSKDKVMQVQCSLSNHLANSGSRKLYTGHTGAGVAGANLYIVHRPRTSIRCTQARANNCQLQKFFKNALNASNHSNCPNQN